MADDIARRSVARSLAVDAHTAEVVAALQDAGVPSVLLKGPTIARWLYTDGTPRPYGDTDLLVPDDRLADAETVLERIGHVRRPSLALELDRRSHAEVWSRADGSGAVDLHWTILETGDRQRVWDVVARDAEPMILAGVEVAIPSEPMRALHTALHAAQHGPAHAKPLEDLRRACELQPFETWAVARDLAAELRCIPELALGLLLIPEGAAIATRLGVDPAGAALESRLRAQGAPLASLMVARVLAQPTWRSRARLALGGLFPPVAFVRLWDREVAGVPSRGAAGAYWRRARWIGAGVPHAVRSYLRTRRRAERP